MKIRSALLAMMGMAAACMVARGAVVFTDTFDHPGSTVADFVAAGWSSVDGTPGDNMGTGTSGNAGATESVFWGNPTSNGNTEAALEYNYGTPVSCGDILSIDANCMRFEGYSYLQEIILWDGKDAGTRVAVTNFNGVGHALGPYATWWTPPAKDRIAPLVYNVTAADAGKYVIFKYGHSAGSGETADVSFSVTPVSVPALVEQPKALVRNVGESASFSVGVLGCGLSYQWKKDGQPINGANKDTYTIASPVVGDEGDYLVTVSNSSGSTNSEAVHLKVDAKLGGGASLSLGINYGDEVPWNPSVTATAYGVHQSRWQDTAPGDENAAVSGDEFFAFGAGQIEVTWSASNTYSVPGDPATLPPGAAQVNYGYLDDGGSGYTVQISGLKTSLGYDKYVIRTVAASDNATGFPEVAVSDPNLGTSQTLTYPVVVAASPTGGKAALSTPSTALSADTIGLASAPRNGTIRGTLAGFVITDKPAIAVQPVAPATVFNGGSFSLSVDAFGVPNLAYQWRKDGNAIPSATDATYSKSAATVGDAGLYDVVVTNVYGKATSSAVTVFVSGLFKPVITRQPASATALVGGSVVLGVSADGGELTYQWKKGGANITGATTITLILTGVSAGDDADYSVTVANSVGSTDSDVVHVTVSNTPGGYLGVVAADHPNAFWRLGETAGTVAADAIGGHNATYSGSMTRGAAGAIPGDANTAVSFTGGNAEAPWSAALNPVQFSAEFWFMPNDTSLLVPLSSQNRDNARAGFCFYQNNGGNNLVADLGTTGSTSVQRLTSTTAPQPGTWYHAVLTYDGSTANLYLNGKLEATLNVDSSLATPNLVAPLLIGDRNGGGLAYSGRVDEVAIYNYALPAARIQAHLAAGIPFRVGIEAASGIVLNAKPDGAPVHGQNNGATWVASNSDGSKTLSGVMQFVATEEDQIAVNAYTALDSPNGTISFWVRSGANAGTGSEAAMLMDRRATGGSGSGTVIALNDNGTVFFQANPTGANPFSSNATINDDKWHHVAVVYQQKTGEPVSIYIDGVLDNTSSNSKDWWWPTGMSVLLGKSRDTYWKKLNGVLDEVRFYSRNLTATEIAQVMAGSVVDGAALKLHLSFDAAPVSGYRLTTSPMPMTVQGASALGATYTDLGISPALVVPSDSMQFFRAKAAQ